MPLQVPGANEQGIRLGSYIPWFEPVLWVSFNTLIPWHCRLGDMKGSWPTRTCAINPQRISSGTNSTNGERIPKRKPAKSLRLTRNGRWNQVVVVMLMVVVTCYFLFLHLPSRWGQKHYVSGLSISLCMHVIAFPGKGILWLTCCELLITNTIFFCVHLFNAWQEVVNFSHTLRKV